MQDPKTILPPSILVSLYKDTLVIPDMEKKSPEKVKESISENSDPKPTPTKLKSTGTLKYLGDHHKKVLVIVDDPHSVYLNETDFILLTSILNACKLTIADIALVNIGNQDTSLHQILETVPSVMIMCFAIESKDLKIKLPNELYRVNELGESILFFSKALSSMQGTGIEAKQEKAKLWNLLKKLFEL